MARPRKHPADIEIPLNSAIDNYPPSLADEIRAQDRGDQINSAWQHLLRKAADGDDKSIALLADLLR